MIDELEGFKYAMVLDGKGRGLELDWDGVGEWSPEDGILWLHLDITDPDVETWLANYHHIDQNILDNLLDPEESRPRCAPYRDSLLLVLRAINHMPNEEEDDMVYVRMFIEKNRIITVRKDTIVAARYIRRKLLAGTGPADSAEFLDEFCACILDNVADSTSDTEDMLDEIEEKIIGGNISDDTIAEVSLSRRKLTTLRRYLGPQRDALDGIAKQTVSWLDADSRGVIKENSLRLTRIIEDIDHLKEQAKINIEEINALASRKTRQNMYITSVLAALFLPFTFITGLLGINVGGIPFAESRHGFIAICLILIGLLLILLVVFRRLKWI